MTEHWIEWRKDGATRRLDLAEGLTRLGGPGSDVVLEGMDPGPQLHFWSDPPKVIHAAGDGVPLLDGRAFEEVDLEDGATLQWEGCVLVYRTDRAAAPVAHEAPAAPSAPSAPSTPSGSAVIEELAPKVMPKTGGSEFERRLHAGILADLGLADKAMTKRWQDAVVRGEWSPEACARDLLGGNAPDAQDPRLLERASRLQRDLLMMPFQRGVKGASRRARAATRTGTAYLIANVIAISVYSLIVVAIMILARVNYDFSFDKVIDDFLSIFK